MQNPAFLSARHQAALIRAGVIGSLELLDLTIERIERHDPRLNAVVVRDFDRARERAKRLDQSKRREGRLYGVPMTVKESFNVAGLPITWGAPERRAALAEANALAVDRLLAQGVVVFGKTNVPLMLADWQSYNEVYGSTNNPWDLARSPGGSSGGSAAALAAGLTGLEVGSDIGGSIRQPAHACGLFGHKPTWGLLPPTGHTLMPGAAAMTDISAIGPLARSADDLSLAFEAMQGPERSETDLAYDLPPPRRTTLKGLRVAVWASDAATQTDDETSALLLNLARHLEQSGAKVDRDARPGFDPARAFEVYVKLLSAALSARASPEELESTAERAAARDPGDRSANAVYERAARMSHGEWAAVNEERHRIRRAWGAFFRDWDVLLCPVFAVPAQPHQQDRPIWEMRAVVNDSEIAWSEMLFWPGVVGGFHLPASTAPLGLTRAGLPVGVQIVGPLYGDRTTIAVARLLERSWRGFTPPPGWT